MTSSKTTLRKRAYSVNECSSSKRIKRTHSCDALSEEEVNPGLEELRQIYRERININKRDISNMVNRIQELVSTTDRHITEFKITFEKGTPAQISVGAGITFLNNLIQTIKKNLEIWDNELIEMEASSSAVKAAYKEETDIVNNETIADQIYNPHTIIEEDEGDSHSVCSNDSQRTLPNVILKEDVEDMDFSLCNLDVMDKFRLCEKNGSFIEPEVHTDVSQTPSDGSSYIFDIDISSPTFCKEYKYQEDINEKCEEGGGILSPISYNSDAPTEIVTPTKDKDGASDLTVLFEEGTGVLLPISDNSEAPTEIVTPTKDKNVASDLTVLVELIQPIEDINLSVEPHPEIPDNAKEDVLVQKVDVVPIDEPTCEMQLTFLQNFGLKANIIVVDDIGVDDGEDIDRTNEALRILKTSRDELMDTSFSLSRSSGTDSYTSDEETDDDDGQIKKMINIYTSDEIDEESGQIGKIVHRLPSLPQTSDSDVEEDKHSVTSNVQSIELKQCCVVLEKLDQVVTDISNDSQKSIVDSNDELNEINRLTNLATLNTAKNVILSNLVNPAKPRYGKLSTKSRDVVSEEDDYTDDDIESIDISGHISIIEPDDYRIELDKARLNALGNWEGEEADDEDSDKHQNKKKNKFNDSDKENKENGSTNNRELTAEEMEKRKWRNDALLRGKLTDSDTDSENEAINIRKKQDKSMKCHTNDMSDKERPSSDNRITIESDSYDSEIEFVSEVKKMPNPHKIRNSIEVSSSDFQNSSSSDEDTITPKKGRKNIRAILSDETLEEETKQAALSEHKRKERLSQKQKAMDGFLSQSVSSTGLVLDVDDDSKKPIIVVHPKLTKRLKSHQECGVRFMWESCYEGVKQLKEDEGSGCILAHCMGLGKTFQVVTLIHTLFHHSVTNTKHILVVCPLSIVLNWKKEFNSGLENLNDKWEINIFNISESYRSFEQRLDCVFKWRQKSGVLIMGYEAFQRLTKFKDTENLEPNEVKIKKALIDPGPDLVILDEGHLLKNGKNNRTQSLMRIKTKRRIVLTGTPLQNNLKEYYYMVQFVKPNLLGSYHEYTNRFVNPITNGQFDDSTEEDIKKMKMRSHVLHKMLKATIQRYEVTELRNYLPPRYDYAIFIELHPVQIELYKHYLEIRNKYSKNDLFCTYHILQYISTHPYLFILTEQKKKTKKNTKEIDIINLDTDPDKLEAGDWWKSLYSEEQLINIEYGTKFNVMLTIIKESEKNGDKVLIFASSLVELDAIEYYLKEIQTETSKWIHKEDYYRMDGSVSPETRLQLCNSFNNERNKRARVFLISHKVGGLGLNLVAANRVILLDVNWNPALDNQSVFRSYRFGQVKKCYVYRLVSLGTMEQVVYDRQVTKSAIARRVVDEKQISRPYKKEDLEDMYRVKFHLYNEKRDPHILPEDPVLKHVLSCHKEIAKYHEHNALLENRPDEQLDEYQRKIAWDDYNKEQENNMREQQKKKIAAIAGAAATIALAAGAIPNTVNAAVAASNAVGAANVATTSNVTSQPTTAAQDVVSFLPSALIRTKPNSTINSVTTVLESKFKGGFNDLKKVKLVHPRPIGNRLETVPVPVTTSTTINVTATQPPIRTKMSEELQQKFSEWAQSSNQVITPQIVHVAGAVSKPNNKVTSSIMAPTPQIVHVAGALPKPNNKVISSIVAPICSTNTGTLANKPIRPITKQYSNSNLRSYIASHSGGVSKINEQRSKQPASSPASVNSFLPNLLLGSSTSQSASRVGNNIEVIPTRQLGYEIPPGLVPPVSSSTGSGASTVQSRIIAINRNLIKMNQPKPANRSKNVVTNIFKKGISSSNVSAVEKNIKKSPTIRRVNQNKVIEIDDIENHANTAIVKNQQALLTSLQKNSNITLSTIGNQSNKIHKSVNSATTPIATNLPAISIIHQKTTVNNNGVIEID